MSETEIRIAVETTIHTPARRVWEVLTDFSGYPSWNPFIRAAKGRLEKGRWLFLFLDVPGGMKMVLFPKVLRVEEGVGFRWLGSLLVPGLFDGEHEFRIVPETAGSSRLVQEEKFTGILVPYFGKMIAQGAKKGFEAMNAAICRKLDGPEDRFDL